MFSKTVVAAILALSLVTMACGINVNLPVEEISTGPTQTVPINIPAPDVDTTNLTIEFGAGSLDVEPGAVNALVEGQATYNVEDLKPEVSVNGGDVLLKSGKLEVRGFPPLRAKNIENEWDLKFGSQPMNLTIKAGAYQGNIELGGLALRSLVVNDGAAEVNLEFSQPNLLEMADLTYTTGASQVELSGLANANFTTMNFNSGAGDYTLDFSGQLKRDAFVTVESGISQVTIIVPRGVNARVSFEGGLSNVDQQDAWESSGGSYLLEGSGPTLTIMVEMGAGNLVLKN